MQRERRRQDGKDWNGHCSQAPAGSLCPESQHEALGSTRSASGGSILKYPKQKVKNAAYWAAEGCVCVFVEKVLFVCRVPQGPKCVKSHVRQYETAQHLPRKLPFSIFLCLATEQSHSSSQRRHSDPSHCDILWESFVFRQQPDETLRTASILMLIIMKKIWIPFKYYIMNRFNRHPSMTR